VDETYWKPSWDICTGLRGERCILGGFWAEEPDADLSYLTSPKVPDETSLSKMTLDYVICRTDSAKQVFHLNMVPVPQRAKPPGSTVDMYTVTRVF
jgi:hypothetical protein